MLFYPQNQVGVAVAQLVDGLLEYTTELICER